jgi:hypothetical protein
MTELGARREGHRPTFPGPRKFAVSPAFPAAPRGASIPRKEGSEGRSRRGGRPPIAPDRSEACKGRGTRRISAYSGHGRAGHWVTPVAIDPSATLPVPPWVGFSQSAFLIGHVKQRFLAYYNIHGGVWQRHVHYIAFDDTDDVLQPNQTR